MLNARATKVFTFCRRNALKRLHFRDDHLINKWNQKTGEVSTVCKLSENVFATDMHWYPANVSGKHVSSELFVIGSTDGGFRNIIVNFLLFFLVS